MAELQKPKKKKLYFEFIRAVSMLMVIFNHTGTKGFFLFTQKMDSPLYPFYLFISIACKVGVPPYWMISGALLLPKDESIKKVYLHRVLRMVIVLIIFSLPYFVLDVIENNKDIGLELVGEFFLKLYTKKHATAFWFIYAYISMLMMLPVLRMLVRAMPRKYFQYLFLLVLLLLGVLPIVEYIASTFPSYMGLAHGAKLKIHSISM